MIGTLSAGQVASPSVSDFLISEYSTDDGDPNQNGAKTATPRLDNATPRHDNATMRPDATLRPNNATLRHDNATPRRDVGKEGKADHSEEGFTNGQSTGEGRIAETTDNRFRRETFPTPVIHEESTEWSREKSEGCGGGGGGGWQVSEETLDAGIRKDLDLRRRCRKNAEQRRKEMHKQESDSFESHGSSLLGGAVGPFDSMSYCSSSMTGISNLQGNTDAMSFSSAPGELAVVLCTDSDI